MRIFFLLQALCLLSFSITFAVEPIIIYRDENKKQFYQGEPVVINIRLTNIWDEEIGFCFNSEYSVHSLTHAKAGDSLWHDPETGIFLVNNRCYKPAYREGVYEMNTMRCNINSQESHVLYTGQELRFPVLINSCPLRDNWECQGRYPFLLPVGNYMFTGIMIFSNGRVYKVLYEFEIVRSPLSERKKLEEFSEQFERFYNQSVCLPFGSSTARTTTDMESFLLYVAEQKDSAINTKSIIHLFPYFLRNGTFTKNYLTLLSGAEAQGIYYFINNFMNQDFVFRREKQEVVKLCLEILQSLPADTKAYSYYFTERILLKLRFTQSGYCGEPLFSVTDEDMSVLWKQKY